MMDILSVLQVVRDLNAPFDAFLGALEYLQMYRDGNMVVHYCDILCDYVYIELDLVTLYYLDMVFVV